MAKQKTHQLKLTEVVQIGFVVKDADKVAAEWSTMFGLGPWRSFYRGSTDGQGRSTDAHGRTLKVKIATTILGTMRIELVQPIEGTGVHAEFLETVGEGLQHIQVPVDDVDGEVSNLVAQGAKVLLSEPGKVAYIGNLPGGLTLEIAKK